MPWNTLCFKVLHFFFYCFLLNYSVCIVPSALYRTIYLFRIMSDIIMLFALRCMKTKLETTRRICYTWKELSAAPCGNPTHLKFGRDSQCSRWLKGRILGQRGTGFNRDIPLETQSNRAFTLCQLHFLMWSNGGLEIRSVFQQHHCRSSKLHTIWKGSALADGTQTI